MDNLQCLIMPCTKNVVLAHLVISPDRLVCANLSWLKHIIPEKWVTRKTLNAYIAASSVTWHISNFKKIDVLTSFPLDFMNSISSGEKLAIDIDLTLCGGFKPRLKTQGILFVLEICDIMKQFLKFKTLSWARYYQQLHKITFIPVLYLFPSRDGD